PVLLVGERIIELADLRPGDKVMVDQIPVERKNGFALDQRIRRGLDPNAFKARYGDASGYGPGGTDPFAGDAAARFRAALARRAHALDPSLGGVPALLAGCVEGDLGGVDLDTAATLEVARALVLSELTIDASGPEIALKDLPGRVLRGKGFQSTTGNTGSPLTFGTSISNADDAQVTFEWRLPASRDLPLDVKRMEIAWDFTQNPDPQRGLTSLKMFSWLHDEFSRIDWIAQTSITQAHAAFNTDEKKAEIIRKYFIPETGVIRVQIETAQPELFLNGITLSVNATRKPREEAPP